MTVTLAAPDPAWPPALTEPPKPPKTSAPPQRPSAPALEFARLTAEAVEAISSAAFDRGVAAERARAARNGA
jgi:hypothetical protein